MGKTMFNGIGKTSREEARKKVKPRNAKNCNILNII